MTKAEKIKKRDCLYDAICAFAKLPADGLTKGITSAMVSVAQDFVRVLKEIDAMPADVVGNHLTDGVGGRCSDKAAAAGAR